MIPEMSGRRNHRDIHFMSIVGSVSFMQCAADLLRLLLSDFTTSHEFSKGVCLPKTGNSPLFHLHLQQLGEEVSGEPLPVY